MKRSAHPAITDVRSTKDTQKTVIVADRKTWHKKTRDAIIYAGILSIVVVLLNSGQGLTAAMHMKEKVMAQTATAYEAFLNGSKALFAGQEEVATAAFTTARTQFAALEEMMIVLTPQLQKNSFSVLQSGKAFFEGSKKLAETAENAATLFTAAAAWGKQFTAVNQATLTNQTLSETPTLTKDLNTLFDAVPSLIVDLEDAATTFDRVAIDDIPQKYQELFQTMRESVHTAHTTMAEIEAEKEAILRLLGHDGTKKYMVLLQNNSEQRPTGGFIGSFLLVDVKEGVFGPISFNDVYDYDWRLVEAVEAPEEIAALTENWRLRDANYSPDFPTSARQAMWFLQKEDGPAVDGVIGIDLTVLEDLLQITGPVSLERFPQPLSAETVQLVLSAVVESKLDGVESPKQIFHDLIPAMLTTVSASPPNLGNAAALLQKMRSQGHLQAYFTDASIENYMQKIGIAGDITPPIEEEDVLQVVHTSIGGNKTDAFIAEEVSHRTFIASDGVVTDQVTITRTHTWNAEIGKIQQDILTGFGLPTLSDGVRFILGEGINKSALRVYVPNGATMVSVVGKETTEVQTIEDADIQQTYFRFVMETAPGTTSTVTLNYRLPFTLDLSDATEYRLTMRPQPGATQQTMTHTLVLSETLQLYAEGTVEFTKKLGTQYAALVAHK